MSEKSPRAERASRLKAAETLLDDVAVLLCSPKGEPANVAAYRVSQELIMAHGKLDELSRPVPMILFCPFCHGRHVDRGNFATDPHHTHACQVCGFVWRPAKVATVGVQFLPGFQDAQ